MATKTSKPKATRKTKQRGHLGVLIDESGSMEPNQTAVIEGYNDFIAALAAEESDSDVRTGLWMFDTRFAGGEPETVREKFANVPLKKVVPLTIADYMPHGSTPLNDAVLFTIAAIDGRLKKGDREPVLLIMTDGEENASRATTDQVRKAIEAKEAAGWTFLYIGANQDAWAVGGDMGVTQDGSFNYTASPRGFKSAMRGMTNVGVGYMSDKQTMYAAMASTSAVTGGTIAEEGLTPEQEKQINDAIAKAKKGVK